MSVGLSALESRLWNRALASLNLVCFEGAMVVLGLRCGRGNVFGLMGVIARLLLMMMVVMEILFMRRMHLAGGLLVVLGRWNVICRDVVSVLRSIFLFGVGLFSIV